VVDLKKKCQMNLVEIVVDSLQNAQSAQNAEMP
jgi:hypothetical protein